MSSSLELVVLNGPLAGEIAVLSPKEPLLLGRSGRGFQIVDSLVSLAHAEIAWEGDRYWIEDLGSATGTFLDDERVGDKAVSLGPEMKIRLGETELEVRVRKKNSLVKAVGLAMVVFLLIIGLNAALRQVEVAYDPMVRWFQPVKQGSGKVSDLIAVPASFSHETGIDSKGLRIRRVTDFDRNDIDEMWLQWDGGNRLVTFDDSDDWVTLSELPPDCRDRSLSIQTGLPAECYQANAVRTELPEECAWLGLTGGFPDLKCRGVFYEFRRDEGYRTVGEEGVVAWLPPLVDEVDPDDEEITVRKVGTGPPEPFRFTLAQPERLAGFLAARGVDEAIHYLICEDALPGIKPQVLTESGDIVALPVGCIRRLDLAGPNRATEFLDERPIAVAFTAHGYESLLRDAEVYLTGGSDGFFHSRDSKRVMASLKKTPRRRIGTVRMYFDSNEGVFDPIPPDQPVELRGRLEAGEFSDPPPALVTTIIIPEAPSTVIDPPGCTELTIRREPGWHCQRTQGCSAGSSLLVVKNTGCGAGGAAVNARWGDGIYKFRDKNVEGRVEVKSAEGSGAVHLLRARLAYRLLDEPG